MTQYNIPLIFYGENEAEYGNSRKDTETALRDKSFILIAKAMRFI